MFERCYDLDGYRVRMAGAGDSLALVVDRLLGPYAADCAGEDIRFDLDRDQPAPEVPAALPRFTFPPLALHERGPGRWLLIDDVGWLEVDATAGRVRGSVPSNAELPALSRFAGLSMWVALIECLRARGRYPLHAAALCDPTGATVLVCGTKGSGKSTLTLALAERGWTVLTDDMVFVEPDGQILGYAKRFHVRPDLAERRPDLTAQIELPPWWEPQDKRWLKLPLATARRAAAPARIYFTGIVDAPRSTAEPLPPREALLELLPHSSFVFVDPASAPEHLLVLRRLIDGARCARLHCGRDLLERPDRYLELAA